MKTQARRCWSCAIAIPRRKRLTPDRRARCPRRSTNSTSFSPAWIKLGDKMTRSSHQSTKRVAGRQGKKTAQGKTPAKLLVAMTGKASTAKTAKGAEPVFAYIASLPQPQRGIAERIDALAAKSLPDIQRTEKWGM